VRISVVSYLNSLPFVYGLEHHPIREKIILEKDIPSECAAKLIDDRADIGLIPVAALPLLPAHYFTGDFGIAADGEVRSVLLLSQVPLPSIEKIMLDYQSRTSVKLVQILCAQYWKIVPAFENTKPGFEDLISGTNAAVVIGDRALHFRDQYAYVYDLAAEWKKFTGFPFVFALWVSNKIIPNQFLESFNDALESGVNQIPSIVNDLSPAPFDKDIVLDYLLNRIHYRLNDSMKKGMNLFLQYLQTETKKRTTGERP